MELLPILRSMWRRRFPLAVGAVVTLALLIGMGGTTPVTTRAAVAWTTVALDTKKSQLVDVAPSGGSTLAWRAGMLGDLMMTSQSTQDVARRIGVPSDQVLITESDLTLPLVPTAMANAAANAATDPTAPYMLSVFTKDDTLPVLSLNATALTPAGATALANAAVAELQAHASSGGTFSSKIVTGTRGLELQPLVINQVSPIRVKVLTSSSLKTTAIALSFLFFVVWVAAALLAPRLFRRLRTSDRRILPV
jgi:hypothetical protein